MVDNTVKSIEYIKKCTMLKIDTKGRILDVMLLTGLFVCLFVCGTGV
jgi:hypothetical protein